MKIRVKLWLRAARDAMRLAGIALLVGSYCADQRLLRRIERAAARVQQFAGLTCFRQAEAAAIVGAFLGYLAYVLEGRAWDGVGLLLAFLLIPVTSSWLFEGVTLEAVARRGAAARNPFGPWPAAALSRFATLLAQPLAIALVRSRWSRGSSQICIEASELALLLSFYLMCCTPDPPGPSLVGRILAKLLPKPIGASP